MVTVIVVLIWSFVQCSIAPHLSIHNIIPVERYFNQRVVGLQRCVKAFCKGRKKRSYCRADPQTLGLPMTLMKSTTPGSSPKLESWTRVLLPVMVT